MVFVATPTLACRPPSPQVGGSDGAASQVAVLPAENMPRFSLPLVGRVAPEGSGGGGKGLHTSRSGPAATPVRLLRPPEVEANWPQLASLLAPAVAHDERRTLTDVHADLIARNLHCVSVEGGGATGLAILEFGTATNGAFCCWVVYIAGSISGAPPRWRQSVRELMHQFESLAWACGATEMRVEGRNWAKILTDYEALSDRPGRNELRKVL